MTSSMTSQGGLKVSLYIHVYERLAPGANCKGDVSSMNANIIIVFLGFTCQRTISMNNTFRDCRSKVNITGSLGDLGTNKQQCKLSQLQFFYFWDCDGIDNVMLRLSKFSDFCSRHCRRRGWWYHVPHSSSCYKFILWTVGDPRAGQHLYMYNYSIGFTSL